MQEMQGRCGCHIRRACPKEVELVDGRRGPTNGLADNRPNTVTISILNGSPNLGCLRMYLVLVMLCSRILFRGELASRSGSCRLRPYGTYASAVSSAQIVGIEAAIRSE